MAVMLPYFACLGLAALLWTVAKRLRSSRLTAAKNGTVSVATVISVTHQSGFAFGRRSRWDDVVGQFADDEGGINIVTKTGPGSPWKPAVGSVFHVVHKPGEPESKPRGVVGSIVRITRPSGVSSSGRIVEADEWVEQFMTRFAAALAIGATAWAAASYAI